MSNDLSATPTPAREKEVVIRNYGLLQPLDWADDCELEFDRMTDFWNALINIHEKYVELYIDQLKLDPEFATAQREYHSLVESASGIMAAASAKKRLAITQQTATRSFSAELKALEASRREDVKIARQNSGLWWGNYNALVRNFEKARSSTFRRGGSMNRRSYGDNNRITNTLQGGVAVEELFDGTLSQIKIAGLPTDAWSAASRGDRRRKQRTTLTATVFVRSGERRDVTWPLIMHRDIPADCRVKEVVITRRRTVGKWKWSASFLCTRSRPPEPRNLKNTSLLAVDIGWRRVGEGLRVATLKSSKEDANFVELGAPILKSFHLFDHLNERLKSSLNKGLEILSQKDAYSYSEPFRTHIYSFQQIATQKYTALNEFILGPFFTQQQKSYIGEELYAWRKEHVRLMTWLANHRRKTVARRNDFYQRVAIDLVAKSSLIIVNDVRPGELGRRNDNLASEGFFPNRVGYFRNIAATSELVRRIKLEARKRGVSFTLQALKFPLACPNCQSTSRSNRADALVQTCASCGTNFDQDILACDNLLSIAQKG